MIEVSKNPNTPYLEHPRGPHFILKTQELLREDKNGNEVYELPLQKIVEYVQTDTSDPIRAEAMALITNNNGMGLLVDNIKAGKTDLVELFSANGPLIHKDTQGKSFPDLDLSRLGFVLVHAKEHPSHPGSASTIKQHITNLITSVGLVPNMDRLNVEFCTNCGK